MVGYKSLEPIPYDPARARQLLAEAGAEGFSFDLLTWKMSGASELPKVAEVVASYWEAIGLKPKIILTDETTWDPKKATWETAGTLWTTRNSGRIDCTQNVRYFSINNEKMYFETVELQALVDKLLPLTDINKRNEVWGEIGKYLRYYYGNVPLVNAGIAFAYSSKLDKGPPIANNKHPNAAYLRHAKPLNTFRLFDLD
jgi:peptide/nickel transport system substrate-binding protein